MKSKLILRLVFAIAITIYATVGQLFAQGNNYKLDGNSNGNANSKLGFTNAADLKLITNDSVRQTITQNGDVIIEKTLTVKGGITADSVVNISAHTVIDSTLRIRGGLIVGDSSLYLDDNVGFPVHDRIRSSAGKISFMQGSNTTYICGFTFFPKFKPIYCTTKTATPNILMGIGTETPKSRLDVLGGAAIGTYAGVNAAPNNGLIVSGNTGIGTNFPQAMLDVNGYMNLRIVDQSMHSTKILVLDPNSINGRVMWRDASTMVGAGATGATGNTGATGSNGNNGATGASGATGNNGTNGITGPTGNNGANGTTGATGNNGTNGTTGATGDTGATGNNGTNGTTGATGNNGTAGVTGATGADGSENAWSLTGNAGTLDGINFIGTTDNIPFNLRVNNQKAGRIEFDPNFANTFLGYQAGNFNGGYQNTANGYQALYSNNAGFWNTAIGYQALYTNMVAGTPPNPFELGPGYSGVTNTAIGYKALYYNTNGWGNTANGSDALRLNTEGYNNTAVGKLALPSNLLGHDNVAVGTLSGNGNRCGSYNTYVGSSSGALDPANCINPLTHITAIGAGAWVGGSNNTALGAKALVQSGFTNSSAVGYNAVAFGSDGEMLGSTTAYNGVRAWGPYTDFSDGRFKTDITENVKGLEFIKKLRPITYQTDTKMADDFIIQNMPDSLKTEHQNGMDFAPSSAIVRSGFIAQEVQQAAQDVGFISSIVHAPTNSADPYGLVYGEFVVPLVKAVQELDSTLTLVSNKGVITSGTPLVNSLTKFTDSSTISNSLISDDGTHVGINTSTSTNTLEINSGVINSSGLTFSNLNLLSATEPSNGKVLSVNAIGEVILTSGGGGATGATGADGATGATGATGADGSLNSWALNGSSGTDDGTNFIGTTDNVPFNIRVNNQKAGRIDPTKQNTFLGYLAGNSSSSGSPGLGSNNTAIGNRALYSNFEGNYNTAIGESALLNTTGYGNTGIGNAALYSNNAGVLNVAIGWEALVGNTSGGNNTAIGNFSGQSNMTGSYNTFLGYSAGSSVQSGLINATAIGANARVTASNSLVLGNAANVGIGTTAPAYKLDVNGDVNVNGTYHQNGNVFTSDQQFKTDVDSISNAVALIKQLKPLTFYFDTTNVYGLNFNDQKQYGLIAQDVEQILPELVSNTTKTATYDTSGTLLTPTVTYKTLNYTAFTAITLKAIQELSNENDSLSEGLLAEKTKTHIQDSINTSLQNQLNQMMTAINSCCKKSHEARSLQLPAETSQSSIKQTDVELSNKNVVVLLQNVPNPFAEQTTINYYLPENVKRAQILFFEQSGKIIKTVDLTEKGKGVLNVFANDLSNGIYTYSLIIDGQIVQTKKMVKQ